MKELLDASKSLRASLDRYISACSVITASYNPINQGDGNSPLLKCITDELRTAVEYEKDIRDTKAMLARSINSSPTLVPISTLPADVLEWIFELVYYAWLRTADFERIETDGDKHEEDECGEELDDIQYQMDIKPPRPMFPDALTHVCSYWRRVALNSRELWRRIDLPIFDQSYDWVLRGETFASRVASPKLDVHILMANVNMIESELVSDELNRFCRSSGSKIRSLQLTNGVETYPHGFVSNLSPLLNASFAYLVPGTLDHLALIDHYLPRRMSSSMLIQSGELVESGAGYPSFVPINVPQHRIDEVLRPIKSLWLRNCFFPWESPAYYGLVDLRLMSGWNKAASIKQSQLAEILSSCPKLRTFHCDVKINATTTNRQHRIDPVCLAELEDLNIRQMEHRYYQDFLPLISPGAKPLGLSIRTSQRAARGCFSSSVSAFLRQSNAAALYIQGDYDNLPLESLLVGIPANVRTLGLQRFHLDEGVMVPVLPEGSCTLRLDCLNLRDCNFTLKKLGEISAVCPIQVLKIETSKCRVNDFAFVTSHTMGELLDIFPRVESVDPLIPFEEWSPWGVKLDRVG